MATKHYGGGWIPWSKQKKGERWDPSLARTVAHHLRDGRPGKNPNLVVDPWKKEEDDQSGVLGRQDPMSKPFCSSDSVIRVRRTRKGGNR